MSEDKNKIVKTAKEFIEEIEKSETGGDAPVSIITDPKESIEFLEWMINTAKARHEEKKKKQK